MNKNKRYIFLYLSSLIGFSLFGSYAHTTTPPYSGTVFVAPKSITSKDKSIANQAKFTRADKNNWIFNVSYSDGLSTKINVSRDYKSKSIAQKEANKIVKSLGQLPIVLRRPLKDVFVKIGAGRTTAVSDKGLFNIYQERIKNRSNDGHLEELVFHEATHIAIDPYIRHKPGWLDGSKKWVDAQKKDNAFISTYAKDHHEREDVAESFALYLTYRFKRNRLSKSEQNNIRKTMSARMAFFDSLNLDLYPYKPLEKGTGYIKYPSPRSMLPKNTVNFEVQGAKGVKHYDVLVGTHGPGSTNIRESNVQKGKVFKVNNLPNNGSKVYVRLFTYDKSWKYKDYIYLSNRPPRKAVLKSHKNNSTLSSSKVTFRWSDVSGIDIYDILVGTTGPGSSNIMSSRVTNKNKRTVTNIPKNGKNVYVRIWTKDTSWSYVDYVFKTKKR